MDFGKAIEISEKYLREFILYLVYFFRGPGHDEKEDVIALADMNRSVVFAIMSALLGAYLWDVLILDKQGVQQDVGVILAETLMRWLSLGLVLFFLMRLFMIKVHIMLPILAVFRVFSVSRIVAIYAAYLADGFLYALPDLSEGSQAANAAPFVTAYIIQLLIIWVFFWRETRDFDSEYNAFGRRMLATFLFLIIVSLTVLIPISEYLCNYVLEC